MSKTKRLVVLIGNGFDKAHGLPTGYGDFAYDIIDQVTEFLYNYTGREEVLDFIDPAYYNATLQNESSKKGTLRKINNEVRACRNLKNKNRLRTLFRDNRILFSYILKNQLLAKLYTSEPFTSNWFDIENNFFKQLQYYHDETYITKRMVTSTLASNLKSVNDDFEFIKNKLKTYLEEKIKPFAQSNVAEFLKNIAIEYDNVLFLNFNYTSTLNVYNDVLNAPGFSTINIHGTIEDNDIIFGYGNDQNEDYQKMKLTEIDEFLTHFKTIDYLRDERYSEFIDFVRHPQDYDVFVLGHSLGLTDKTLLDEVLNSSNCSKIHLFRRIDSNLSSKEIEKEHIKLRVAAIRIINDERDARDKIIKYNKAISFPSS